MAYKNKEDQAIASRKHYEANKDKIKARAVINTKQVSILCKKFRDEYLLTHHCVDCGNSNPIVLEFDHVRGKKRGNISNMIRKGYSLDSIQKEVAKCEVRCANCHRIATFNRRQVTN